MTICIDWGQLFNFHNSFPSCVQLFQVNINKIELFEYMLSNSAIPWGGNYFSMYHHTLL